MISLINDPGLTCIAPLSKTSFTLGFVYTHKFEEKHNVMCVTCCGDLSINLHYKVKCKKRINWSGFKTGAAEKLQFYKNSLHI